MTTLYWYTSDWINIGSVSRPQLFCANLASPYTDQGSTTLTVKKNIFSQKQIPRVHTYMLATQHRCAKVVFRSI